MIVPSLSLGLLLAASDADSKYLSVAAEAGIALVSFGGASVPPQPSFRIGAAVPIALTKRGSIEPGLSMSFTPLPWAKDTEWMTTFVVSMIARFDLLGALDLRIDAGAGALVLSRLHDGNPYSFDGTRTPGSLIMAHFRGNIGFDYWLNDVIALSATPIVFAVTPPHSRLRHDIILIHQLDIAGGLRLQL